MTAWDNFCYMNALGSGVRNLLWQAWRIIRWPIYICAALYLALVVFELFHLPKVTAATVASIHAQRLTAADVDGEHLPPQPDPKLVDATIAGIDVNKNGIRDDVELAIFKKYPNDIKVRAAELQYAMELQNEFTKVVDSKTLIAVAQEEGRGSSCVSGSAPALSPSSTVDEVYKSQQIAVRSRDEVKQLVYNTSERTGKQEEIYRQYMTSYTELKAQECDIIF